MCTVHIFCKTCGFSEAGGHSKVGSPCPNCGEKLCGYCDDCYREDTERIEIYEEDTEEIEEEE